MLRTYRWKVEDKAEVSIEETEKPQLMHFVITRWDDNWHESRARLPKKVWDEIYSRTLISSRWNWNGTTNFRGAVQYLDGDMPFHVEEGSTPETITIRIGDNHATVSKDIWEHIHSITNGYSADNFTFIEE